MTHVFKGNVHHNKVQYKKGEECPKDIHETMLDKGLIAPLPEPVRPVKSENQTAPQDSAKTDAQEQSEEKPSGRKGK